MRIQIASCVVSIGALLIASSPSPARAQASGAVAVASRSPGQPALGVGFVGAKLRARVCPTNTCALTQGLDVDLPADADPTQATMTVVRLRRDRSAIHVRAPMGAGDTAWEAVLAAPLQGSDPLVVYQGKTGFVSGQYGLRHGGMVIVTDADEQKTRSILVGEQWEELTLCGRPTILKQRLLDPSDLTLKPATVQRLSVQERAGAARLRATPAAEGTAPAPGGMLRGPVASGFAKGFPPSALVDGDLDTAWAEGRGGPGRGEFVAMQASPDQSIVGFEMVVRPPQAQLDGAEAPGNVWLATTSTLFHVELPDDAWDHPGQRLEVTLPEPVATDCVALVMDSFPPHPRGDRATVAELVARSALAESSIAELVEALPGGDSRSQQAAAALRSRGEPAFRAVAAAFAQLDEGGRREALHVIDQAPCAIRAEVYVQALSSTVEAQRSHAEARLRDCGEFAASALLAALDDAPEAAVGRLADQLALVAPAQAVRTLVPRLAGASANERRTMRVVLGRAAQSPAVRSVISGLLRDPTLDESAAIDLLRALGPQLPGFAADAGATFTRLDTPGASFRTRYLLLEPAADLASRSSVARSLLRKALADERDWRIRSHAAEVIRNTAPLQDLLLAALSDESVRVRIAAIRTVARAQDVPASSHLAEILRHDHWPIARAESAMALGDLEANSDVDRALLGAVRDSSRHVRAPALIALGKRGVREAAKPARKRLVDDDEAVNVRTAAAVALGRLCDPGSIDELTRIARRMADPHDLSQEREVAPAAVTALGRIHPRDLESRLAPLTKKGAPPVAQAAARAALSAKGDCPR